MRRLVLDAGALIAIERGDRRVGAILREAALGGFEALTSSACVAQAWRNPARQARMVRALAAMREVPFDSRIARDCGRLLAQTGRSDIVDAAVALLGRTGDVILTSDPGDILTLLADRGGGPRVHGV